MLPRYAAIPRYTKIYALSILVGTRLNSSNEHNSNNLPMTLDVVTLTAWTRRTSKPLEHTVNTVNTKYLPNNVPLESPSICQGRILTPLGSQRQGICGITGSGSVSWNLVNWLSPSYIALPKVHSLAVL